MLLTLNDFPLAQTFDKINEFVPLDKQRDKILKFLEDPKNLSDLEAVAKNNITWDQGRYI